MAKGRPADPTRSRRGTGNRPQAGQQKAALAKAPPVNPVAAAAEPPDTLPAGVEDVWRECVAEMAGNRHLRQVDLALVESYCQTIHVMREASANVNRYGVLVKGPKGPIVNPLLRVQKDAAATMRQLSDTLGLNPSVRIHLGLLEVMGGSLLLGLREQLMGDLADD